MYQITEYGPDGSARTDTVVVDAPSPGTAIEYFLVMHGMLSYYDIVLEEVEGPSSDGFERWEVYKAFGSLTASELEALRDAHTWRSPTKEPV